MLLSTPIESNRVLAHEETMQCKARLRLAVVGFGPRGLGALEALADIIPISLSPLKIDVFEPFDALGAGPNFDPRESPVCRLNIPVRDIDIRPRNVNKGRDFASWLKGSPDPNTYPSRAEMGRYLVSRYSDLRHHSALDLTFHSRRVETVRRNGDVWNLMCEGEALGPYAEVLLTLGQPEVALDSQLKNWCDHAAGSTATVASAYPAHQLAQKAQDWRGATVAIRGLALSAFDVIRVLTVAQGGRFEGTRYIPSGHEPARIVPFSLDGRPPYPKPKTAKIDSQFAPTAAEEDAFLEKMTQASAAPPCEARDLIDDVLVPLTQRVLSAAGCDTCRAAVAEWLEKEWTSPGSQEAETPVDMLRHGIAMAEGRSPPDIGYALGQVWRKLQDEIRQGYNPTETTAETAEVLIGFDEGLKRYSYGPPVSSSRELIALIEAGIVDLYLSCNPSIALVNDGWKLSADDCETVASVMVDAVLPSPDLSIITEPLVKTLVEDGRMHQLTDGFGGTVAPDGTIQGATDRPSPGIALLGRLAFGSVIAVDSLHDCFGEASHRWARGVVKRIEAATGNASS